MNHGQNVAEDVTYSGTVAGAMEGTILGVRSIALCQAYGPGNRDDIRWELRGPSCAGRAAPAARRRLPGQHAGEHQLPNCAPDEVQGAVATVQGKRNQELLRVEERFDGRSKPYYWIAFARGKITPGEGTDLQALAEKRISITPINLDLTDNPTVTELARVFGG